MHTGCECAVSEVSHKGFCVLTISSHFAYLFTDVRVACAVSVQMMSVSQFVGFLDVSYIVHSCKQRACLLVGG